MTLLRASTGAIVNLGQLLGRGGEGSVHAVVGSPKLVAKVYLKPPDAAKADKLRLMIRGASPELLGVSAWPVDLLTDERGAVRGFLMGRISARQDAHRLYTPKSRRGTFPDADFRFVVRAATNLSRAFAQIHAVKHVIGDVNHGNALIGKDGTAVLIDCDSIQVRDRTRIFSCDVGTPLFTPPELQGKAFRGLRRTEESDRFGLAVLIFHLLFQGRHPYAGVYADGEMPLERAIAESRFAYGASAASLGMSAPPGTLPLTTFGRPIARLFERAFAPPGGEEQRPSAIEWIEALQQLEQDLKTCPRSPRHFYPGSGECCWCAIEEKTGARLFGEAPIPSEIPDAVTVEQLWKAIEGVKPPAEVTLPGFAEQEAKSLDDENPGEVFFKGLGLTLAAGIPIAIGLSTFMNLDWVLVLMVCTVIAGALYSLFGDKGPSSPRRSLLRRELQFAIDQWRKGSSPSLFATARAKLSTARHKIDQLAKRQRKELDRIKGMLEQSQYSRFLDKFPIDQSMFIEVTKAHIETLANRGVRSAGDVRRRRRKMVGAVPDAVIGELSQWATQCADTFRFDPNDAAYLAEAQKVDEKYRRQREAVMDELRRGPELLQAKLNQVAEARARAEDVLREKSERVRQRREKMQE